MIEVWCICLCGLGSGTLLKLTTSKALDKLGVKGRITVYGVTDIPGGGYLPDIVLTQQEIYKNLKQRPAYQPLFEKKPNRIVVTSDFVDVDKIAAILKPVIRAVEKEQEKEKKKK